VIKEFTPSPLVPSFIALTLCFTQRSNKHPGLHYYKVIHLFMLAPLTVPLHISALMPKAATPATKRPLIFHPIMNQYPAHEKEEMFQ